MTISWIDDPADATLFIGAVKKPWLLPESEIDHAITSLVESSKPEAR